MSNMSYCRFRNTLLDLRDCYDNINDLENDEFGGDSESAARRKLIDLCCDIALAYGDEVDRNIQEED